MTFSSQLRKERRIKTLKKVIFALGSVSVALLGVALVWLFVVILLCF